MCIYEFSTVILTYTVDRNCYKIMAMVFNAKGVQRSHAVPFLLQQGEILSENKKPRLAVQQSFFCKQEQQICGLIMYSAAQS